MISSLFYQVMCGSLGLDFGDVEYNTSPSNGTYPVDTEASVSCNQYFRREGPSPVICNISGDWSPVIPICNASNKINTFL